MNTELAYIEKIDKLGDWITENLQEPIIQIDHFFIPGVYVRVGFLPADSILTGKIHNYECINIVAKGKISVATKEGFTQLEAGAIFNTPAGTKKAGYVIEDTVFITVHGCDKTNIEEVENYLSSDTYEDYLLKMRGLTCLQILLERH